MTDLEMTKLCAEAMGYVYRGQHDDALMGNQFGKYDPLHDDAQAMALVKKFKSPHFQLWSDDEVTGGKWHAWVRGQRAGTSSDSLNRAIVECVAKMQAAK